VKEPREQRQQSWRRALDSWFPTLVRYAGFATMLYGIFIDHASNPAILPAATGMILFKTVYGSGDRE
jgi:folate-dependent phosphoribosylglycinamide formyltransferase PurN